MLGTSVLDHQFLRLMFSVCLLCLRKWVHELGGGSVSEVHRSNVYLTDVYRCCLAGYKTVLRLEILIGAPELADFSERLS